MSKIIRKIKRDWIIWVCGLLFVALMGSLYLALRSRDFYSARNFTVTIVHQDGTKEVFPHNSNMETIGAYLLAEGIIKGEMGEQGLLVLEVNGERAVPEENGAFWAFYVNGKKSPTSIDQTPLKEGKRYELRYEICSES